MGYQMPWWLSTPYSMASSAMATLPASPPLMPADTGYVSSGSHARCTSGASGSRSTAGREVATAGTATSTGTASWDSWG